MNKLGLVFAGGGGKGGYEIGVWEYLHSIGLDKYVSVVSGTSVGALNATLFTYGNLTTAKNIWLTQIQKKILDPHDVKKYVGLGIKAGVSPMLLKLPVILKEIGVGGLFSRDGLKHIIQANIDLRKVSASKIKLYGACCHIPDLTGNEIINILPAKLAKQKAEYFNLNGALPDFIEKVLLASSAIPGAFGAIKINGKEYFDGGLKDNIPVRPLYDEGCTHAIIVHLDHKSKLNEKWTQIENTVNIIPSEDLGNFWKGTLDFSPKGTKRRIELGFDDAKRLKYKLDVFLNTFKEEEKVKEEKSIEEVEEDDNFEKEENAICLKCKNRFRIENLGGGLLEVQKGYECPLCKGNKIMRIKL